MVQKQTTTLNQLRVGEQARINRIDGENSAYRRKLLSMGCTPGAIVKVITVAPLGDPIAIQVRGYCLSLRKTEASCIQVENLP